MGNPNRPPRRSLQADLDDLEQRDPSVSAAASNYRRALRRILDGIPDIPAAPCPATTVEDGRTVQCIHRAMQRYEPTDEELCEAAVHKPWRDGHCYCGGRTYTHTPVRCFICRGEIIDGACSTDPSHHAVMARPNDTEGGEHG